MRTDRFLRECVQKPAWTATDIEPRKQKGKFRIGQKVFLRSLKAIYNSCRVVGQKPAGLVVEYTGIDRDDKSSLMRELVEFNRITELRPYVEVR